jgi:hypothetical protein
MERPAAPRPNVPPQNQGAPPPRIPQTHAQPLPPPVRPSPVILAPQRKLTPPAIPSGQPPPVVRTTTPLRPVIIAESEGPAKAGLAKMGESRESYARGASLQKSVAQRLAAIDQQTVRHKPTQPAARFRPPAAAEVLRTFRNPKTIRHAFLASFVLNPPKALE